MMSPEENEQRIRFETRETLHQFIKQLKVFNNVMDKLKPIYFKFSKIDKDMTEEETEALLGPTKFKELKDEMTRLSEVDWL